MRTIRLFLIAPLLAVAIATSAAAQSAPPKLGPLSRQKAAMSTGTSRVIIRAADGASLLQLLPSVQKAGGILGRELPIIHARVAVVPNAALNGLSQNPLIEQISIDRPIRGSIDHTAETVLAPTARQTYALDGTGVGVALIDSGVSAAPDDLTGRTGAFVDFVNGAQTPYDDYGHGTHVAGIVAGSGYDSDGGRTGIAPGSRLVVLKVLDGNGGGSISNVIAALDYIHANRATLNVRVVNMSIAAGVYESYNTDPLTLAAKRVVDDGIVVVAAAGNLGHNSLGQPQYGGITAPANAPWVLTVGASSHMGTGDRADDTMAAFSSHGPTAHDYGAKPDLVAPGVGTQSLSSPNSTFYTTKAPYLLQGTVATSYLPYLSLSGTSMAAPVVTGTVALMLQANPALTPNAVKAILEYTSQFYKGYDPVTEGAGFLNALGAVQMARYFADPSSTYPSDTTWGRRVIWGNHGFRGGRLRPDDAAWGLGVTWGTPGYATWAHDYGNVVWGLACGGADCTGTVWSFAIAGSSPMASDSDTVVWGSFDSDTVVWGSSDFDTVVWGSSSADSDTVVWGSSDSDTVVWGSSGVDSDTVVWGSSGSDSDTVVWGSSCGDSSCDPVLWPN